MNFKTLLFSLFAYMVSQVSPFLVKSFDEMLDKLEKKVEKTPSPFDDIIVRFLRRIIEMKDYAGKDVLGAGTILSGILAFIVVQLSPKARALLVEGLGWLMMKAKSTKNPYDDIFVEMLYRIFHQPVSD